MRRLLVIAAVFLMLPAMGAAQLESVPSAATGHGDTVSELAEQPVVEKDGELDNRVAPEAKDHGEKVRELARNGGTQHDEFDTEEKMTEKTENGKDVRIVKEKKIGGERSGNTEPIPAKIDHLDDRKQVNLRGPPTFDDLEMERGFAVVDWREGAQKVIINVRCDAESPGSSVCGEANLKGGTVANTILAGMAGEGDFGREPEEKETEFIVPDTAKEKPQRGKVVALTAIKNAGNGPGCDVPIGLKDSEGGEDQRPSAGDGPACDVPIGLNQAGGSHEGSDVIYGKYAGRR